MGNTPGSGTVPLFAPQPPAVTPEGTIPIPVSVSSGGFLTTSPSWRKPGTQYPLYLALDSQQPTDHSNPKDALTHSANSLPPQASTPSHCGAPRKLGHGIAQSSHRSAASPHGREFGCGFGCDGSHQPLSLTVSLLVFTFNQPRSEIPPVSGACAGQTPSVPSQSNQGCPLTALSWLIPSLVQFPTPTLLCTLLVYSFACVSLQTKMWHSLWIV